MGENCDTPGNLLTRTNGKKKGPVDSEITASRSVTKLPPECWGLWAWRALGNKFKVEAKLEKCQSCERHEPADLVTVNLGADLAAINTQGVQNFYTTY
jgi:hypothetical protein